jgi:hypothetical protein
VLSADSFSNEALLPRDGIGGGAGLFDAALEFGREGTDGGGGLLSNAR